MQEVQQLSHETGPASQTAANEPPCARLQPTGLRAPDGSADRTPRAAAASRRLVGTTTGRPPRLFLLRSSSRPREHTPRRGCRVRLAPPERLRSSSRPREHTGRRGCWVRLAPPPLREQTSASSALSSGCPGCPASVFSSGSAQLPSQLSPRVQAPAASAVADAAPGVI
ncbi:hypothetical protein E2562_013628 [Oryza meyeriana var. granulata]|uniref:Uncharacterized protein n=1 Tax=Oryza meyeriana var. granulata TaxID=110450 RepID=A0A6G1F7W0_9ORYZ|nr:hypothetical protein E2562_013628 [Oryza meyeriana var. granulata]